MAMVIGLQNSMVLPAARPLPERPREQNSLEALRGTGPDSGSVFDAVDLALDLSHKSPRDLMGAMNKLTPGECQEFLSMLAELLQQGIIGTETLEVNGEPYTCYLPTRMGDTRLMHARTWQAGERHSLDLLA